MILTDYYRFQKLPDQKSVMRIDCTGSTKSYPEFEALRNKAGSLFVYFGNVPDRFGGDIHRKSDKAITKVKNLSSVFVPDVTKRFGYGDMRGSMDALLFLFGSDYSLIDVFVARGQRNNRMQLYNLLSDGELTEEIEELKSRLVTEIVTTPKE